MIETPDTDRPQEGGQPRNRVAAMEEVHAWFIREVLPLEAALMQYLHRNWRRKDDIPDLRNDIYVQVYEAALRQIPDKPQQFVIVTARNLLINRFLREQIVPFDAIADMDNLEVASEAPGPDRALIARDELRKLSAALDLLPPRCREAVVMRRIEGLSRREIALRMGISENAVAGHVRLGMSALADMLFGEPDVLTRRS